MRLSEAIPLDVRQVGHKNLDQPSNAPRQMYSSLMFRIWIRAKEKLPSSIAFHHCVAAYASDFELLNTSLIPHGLARWGEHRKLTMVHLY